MLSGLFLTNRYKNLKLLFNFDDVSYIEELKSRCILLNQDMDIDDYMSINTSGKVIIYLEEWIKASKYQKLDELIIPDFVNIILYSTKSNLNYNKPIIFPSSLECLYDSFFPYGNITLNTESHFNILDFSRCKNIKKLGYQFFVNLEASKVILPNTCNSILNMCFDNVNIKEIVFNGILNIGESIIRPFIKSKIGDISVIGGYNMLCSGSILDNGINTKLTDIIINKNCILKKHVIPSVKNLYLPISKLDYKYFKCLFYNKYIDEHGVELTNKIYIDEMFKYYSHISGDLDNINLGSFIIPSLGFEDTFFIYFMNMLYFEIKYSFFEEALKEYLNILLDTNAKIDNIYLYNVDKVDDNMINHRKYANYSNNIYVEYDLYK